MKQKSRRKKRRSSRVGDIWGNYKQVKAQLLKEIKVLYCDIEDQKAYRAQALQLADDNAQVAELLDDGRDKRQALARARAYRADAAAAQTELYILYDVIYQIRQELNRRYGRAASQIAKLGKKR